MLPFIGSLRTVVCKISWEMKICIELLLLSFVYCSSGFDVKAMIISRIT